MADETIRDGEIEGDEEALLDQPTGNAHSAFLPDEELHDQLPDEAEGDERTALTAAHQGARGTSTPAESAAAFNRSADPDLLDVASERADSRSNATNRAFDDPLSGNPALDNLAGFDSEPSIIDGDAAQSAPQSSGRAAAATTEQNSGNSQAARTNVGDEPQLNDDGANQDGAHTGASHGGTAENLSLDIELPADAATGADSLGANDDQDDQQAG